MANIFLFGNYAAKTEVNLSFSLKPDFMSGLSFGLKL